MYSSGIVVKPKVIIIKVNIPIVIGLDLALSDLFVFTYLENSAITKSIEITLIISQNLKPLTPCSPNKLTNLAIDQIVEY